MNLNLARFAVRRWMEVVMKNDLTGKRFGRLTAKFVCGKSKDRHYLWHCVCDCGNEVVVPSNGLTCRHTKSCGCLQRDKTSEARIKHGASGNHREIERLYRVWISMRARCNNPNNKSFKYYGGKGVLVCDEWSDYSAFKRWAENNGYDKNENTEIALLTESIQTEIMSRQIVGGLIWLLKTTIKQRWMR